MFGASGGCRSMVRAKCIGLKFIPVALSSHFAALVFLGQNSTINFYTAFPLLDSQSPPKLRRIKRHISQEIKEWDEETDQEEGHNPEELTWGFMEDAKADHKPGHIML